MRVRARLFLVVLVVAMAAVSAASAEEIEPVFNRQDVWFTHTDTPLTNVDAYSNKIPTWKTTPPTTSTPLGAGGVYASHHYSWGLFSNGREHNPLYGFTAKGSFTGDIDNLAVTLYGYVPAYAVLGKCGGGIALSFDLKVDGESILYQSQTAPSAYLNTEILQAGYVSVKFRFTRIYEMMRELGMATGPDVAHTVYLNAMNFYACNEVAWVFDSLEAPAGAVFNLYGTPATHFSDVDVFEPPPPYGN
jgi:hypothetical protein